MDKGDNTNPNLLTTRPTRTHNTDALVIKLNRLPTIEPTIGNYDQEFIRNWYSSLKDFSFILMKQIVTYCKKTEQKTLTNITEIETTLKQQLKKI